MPAWSSASAIRQRRRSAGRRLKTLFEKEQRGSYYSPTIYRLLSIMALRKVTIFDKPGSAVVPVDEEGQAKPCVLGVRWVNPDTFETIRVRGGVRTGPHNEVLKKIEPTLDLSPFANDDFGKTHLKVKK
jgi:hypothetical protein